MWFFVCLFFLLVWLVVPFALQQCEPWGLVVCKTSSALWASFKPQHYVSVLHLKLSLKENHICLLLKLFLKTWERVRLDIFVAISCYIQALLMFLFYFELVVLFKRKKVLISLVVLTYLHILTYYICSVLKTTECCTYFSVPCIIRHVDDFYSTSLKSLT